MRTDDLDEFFPAMTALRDQMIERVERQIEAYAKRRGELAVWTGDLQRQGEAMLEATDFGEPTSAWAEEIATFNRLSRPHRKKQIQHARDLQFRIEARIKTLRTMVADLRSATQPVLGQWEPPTESQAEITAIEKIAERLVAPRSCDTPNPISVHSRFLGIFWRVRARYDAPSTPSAEAAA